MTTLFGISFNSGLSFKKALVSIPGIGYAYADFLLKTLHFGPDAKLGSVSREQLKFVTRTVLQQRLIGVSLERDTRANILRKVNAHSYQGIRHTEGLPVRGQNTKTNASTSRRLKKKLR